MNPSKIKYNELLVNIGSALQNARQNAIKAINTELVRANWEIGRYIVEFEQDGKEKAIYGSGLLLKLSTDLKMHFGKGFSRSNLQLMRLFYIKYPNEKPTNAYYSNFITCFFPNKSKWNYIR
jgi:hypothetical protein